MTTKTVRIKASQIAKEWHVIDAADRPLGRVASEVAVLLRGKHKPTFEPHLDGGDFVIVVNARKVRLSGNKEWTKTYYRHSGYPGGLRSRSFVEQRDRAPEKIIEKAVWGMLPHGPLGKRMLKHLKIYPGPDHPHTSQVVGSERARERREAELAATLTEERKPPRLRPLSRSAAPAAIEAYPEAEAAVAAPPPRPEPGPVAEPTTLPQDESAAGAEAALKPAALAEAAAPAPAGEDEPKPRARRKKAEPEAEGEAPAEATTEPTTEDTEEQKPRRRTAKTEE